MTANPEWNCAHTDSIIYRAPKTGEMIQKCLGYNLSGGNLGMRQQCSSWRYVQLEDTDRKGTSS